MFTHFNREDPMIKTSPRAWLTFLIFAALLQFATAVLNEYGVNLGTILYELRTGLTEAKIFVANQYTIPGIDAIVPLASVIVRAFNGVVNQVVSRFPSNVYVVDVYSAF